MGGRAGHRTGVAVLVLALAATIAVPGALGATTAPSAAPTLSLSAAPGQGSAPLTVDFLASLTPSTTFAEFDWSFGDGNSYQVSAEGSSDPVHQYDSPGQYLAEVTANASGTVSEASLVVSVEPAALTASIDTSQDVGPAPLTVQFYAGVFGGTGTYSSVAWEFGNGENGSGLELNLTYTSPGVYLVNLTVVDSSGSSVRVSAGIWVEPPASTPASSSPFTPEIDLVLLAVGAAFVASVVYALAGSRRSRWSGAPGPVPQGAAMGPARAPTPGRPAGAAALPPAEVQETYERVLTYLYWTGRRAGASVGRVEVTREGIAQELHVAPSTVGRALRRLSEAGVVTASLEHVPGAPRRVWCYAVTPRGESAARLMGRPGGPDSPGPDSTML